MRHLPRGDPHGVPQRLQLLLLGRVALLPPHPLGAPRVEVVGPAAAVAGRTVERGVEVEHVGAHGVEERAVVARRDHHPRQPPELVLQERGRLVVEVVGGLVQQQRTGAPDEQRGEPEPAALPARQRVQPPSPFDGGQAEPGQHEGRAAVGVPCVVIVAPLQTLAVPAQNVGVVGPDGELGGQGIKGADARARLPQRVVEHRGDGGIGGEGQLLVAEAEVCGPADASGVGLLDAGEQAQQRRLAGAVLADEAEPAPGGHGEREPVEDGAVG